MKTPVGTALLAIATVVGVVAAFAQPPEELKDSSMTAPVEYRVIDIVNLFDGDPEAKARFQNLAKTFKDASDTPITIRRDMPAADYEHALNRLSEQGWELVTITPYRKWVFRWADQRNPRAVEP